MNVRELITSWGEEESILEGEGDDDTVAFHLRVRPPVFGGDLSGDDTVLDVTHATEDDRIRVFSSVRFDEVFWEAMKELDLDDFIGRISPDLDALPSACLLDYGDGVLSSITLIDEIFFDGLTKDRFMQSLRGVHKSTRMALWALRPLIDSLLDPGEYIESESPPEAAVEEDACLECGHLVDPGQSFCTQCGSNLGGIAPEVQGGES